MHILYHNMPKHECSTQFLTKLVVWMANTQNLPDSPVSCQMVSAPSWRVWLYLSVILLCSGVWGEVVS